MDAEITEMHQQSSQLKLLSQQTSPKHPKAKQVLGKRAIVVVELRRKLCSTTSKPKRSQQSP
jgi:hypothetical protein